MGNGKCSASAALRLFRNREAQKGLRALKLPSIAALRREQYRYPEVQEGGLWKDGGYETRAPALVTRVECIEIIGAIACGDKENPLNGIWLELLDEWVTELHEKLPLALKRPLAAAELRPVLDRAKRYEAECAAERKKIDDEVQMRLAAV